jgi:hypothetical protein
MMTPVLIGVLVAILVWCFYRREGYADYPGDTLPYDPSSDPFKYSGLGEVGYIGPDPVDARIKLVKSALSKKRKGVEFVRIDFVQASGKIQTARLVFMDDSTKPYGYQVTARIDTSKRLPTLLGLKVSGQSIDITNGLAAAKYTQGLIQKPATEQLIAAAVKQAILKRDGNDLQFVSTQSLNNTGKTYSAVMFFMDSSDFPIGIVVRATVDMGQCPPKVVNLAYSQNAVSSSDISPTNVATTLQGIKAFDGDTFFPFVQYNTIQQAAAPDLKNLKTYNNALGNAAANTKYQPSGSLIDTIEGGAVGAFNTVKDGAVGAYNTVKDGTVGAYNTVKDGTLGTVNTVKDGTVGAANTVAKGATGAAKEVAGFFGGF